MAKTLYDYYWFVQFDFPDTNGKPYKSTGEKMVWNEELKREIPEGWEVKTIDKFADFKNGKRINKEYLTDRGQFAVYGSNGIVWRTDQVLFSEPVIAIGRVGANYGEVHYSLDMCWVSDNSITSQPVKKEYFWWLILILKSVNYPNIAGGSAQPLITKGQLRALPIAISNNGLIEDFHKIFNSSYLKLNENQKENQELASLRDWLLPMLMNGQVSVGDVEELAMVAEERENVMGSKN
jgi:type I restriction enzyme S subunit